MRSGGAGKSPELFESPNAPKAGRIADTTDGICASQIIRQLFRYTRLKLESRAAIVRWRTELWALLHVH